MVALGGKDAQGGVEDAVARTFGVASHFFGFKHSVVTRIIEFTQDA
jgi:hypothetical protein